MRISDWSSDVCSSDPLGGLDGGLFLTGRHGGDALGAAGIGQDLVAVLDVGEAVVEEGENCRRDLLAQAVTGAEILVDPDLHGWVTSVLGGSRAVLTAA